MSPQTLTLGGARESAVEGALLAGARPPADADGILAVIRRLGGLQIDPTRTVEKTHLLVLWSRLGSYDRAVLDRLLWQERRLVEYNAFIVPVERLPEVRFMMACFATGSRRPGCTRGPPWRAPSRRSPSSWAQPRSSTRRRSACPDS